MPDPTFDDDWRLRLQAFAQLGVLAAQHGGVVTPDELDQGFEFEGERIRFWDPPRGIWRPRQLGAGGAALTLVTAPLRPCWRRRMGRCSATGFRYYRGRRS